MPRILDVDIYSDIDRPSFLIDGYHGAADAAENAADAAGGTASASGGFTINGAPLNGSVLCHPEAVFLWDVARVDDLSLESLVAARALDPAPELLLLGTGATAQLPPPAHWRAIKEWASGRGIGVEIMDSPSACSTFNILTQEDRRVVAALIAVDAVPRGARGALVPPGATRAAPVGRGGRSSAGAPAPEVEAKRLAPASSSLSPAAASSSSASSAPSASSS